MKRKVLVVEDDLAIADFAEMVLIKEGYEVEKASDGREGFEKALTFRPDLLLLDLMMPEMDGFEVCAAVRKEEKLKGTAVIIASSKSFASDFENAKTAGADGYLTKPYGAKDLAKKVKDHMPEEKNGSAGGGPGETSSEKPDAAGAQKGRIAVRFWGTRGSSPTPGPNTVRYGGNTSCTEIRIGSEIFIVDCGSGIRELGVSLLKEYAGKPIVGHIFVGHTHWDHIQGFPFFTPFYFKENKFSVYSVRGAGKSLERVFRGQMAADYFPVPLKSLACDLQFVEMEEAIDIGPAKVQYHFLNHPGIAIGYRFDAFGHSVAYISDHEGFVSLGGDNKVNRRQEEALIEFVRGVDVLIMESQYTAEEYKMKRGWGHSTFSEVVQRGIDAGAGHLILFHHDPTHTDEMMDAFLETCRDQIKAAGSSLHCSAAMEGKSHTV